MKRKIFTILFVVVIITTFTVTTFADAIQSNTRSDFYVSNYPLNVSLQVNGDQFTMVSFGDIGASFPLKYEETYTTSGWAEVMTSIKTTSDIPEGTEVYTRCTLLSNDTELSEVIYDIATQYFGDETYSNNVELYVDNISYSVITATTSSIYVSNENEELTMFYEPEYYETTAIYNGTSEEAITALGDFARCFTFTEFTTEGDINTETKTYTVNIAHSAVRNNEGNGFRAVLNSTFTPNADTLYYVDGYYQFRPTFEGGAFTMFQGGQPMPTMNIGSKTAKVIYNVTYAYVAKSITSGEVKIAYDTYSVTETSATGAVELLPTCEQLASSVETPSGYISGISSEFPYIYIISYTTEISVRRAEIGDSYLIRNYFGELTTAGIPYTFSDTSHFLNMLTIRNESSGIGNNELSGLGGLISAGVGGFFNTPLFAGYSIGSILMLVVAIGVIFALLKIFAGG